MPARVIADSVALIDALRQAGLLTASPGRDAEVEVVRETWARLREALRP